MRRAWHVIVAGVVIANVAAACGSSSGGSAATTGTSGGAPRGSVSLFGYEDAFVPKAIGALRKRYPHLHITTTTYSTNDDALAKLRAGFQTDAINICVEDPSRLNRLGLLQPIDTSRVPVWNSLNPVFKKLNGVDIGGKVWMVPVDGGSGGIIYNPKRTQPVTTWRQLFTDPALKGKVALENSPESVIAVAGFALGYKNPYAMTDADLNRVRTFLLAHRDQIRTFFDGDADFLNLYESGEIVAGFGYHDYRATLSRAGYPVKYVTSDGALAWFCGWGITAHAHNLPAVYAVLNYYASAHVEKYYATTYTYFISNKKVVAALPTKLLNEIGINQPQRLQSLTAMQLPPSYPKWVQIYQELQAAP